MPDVPHARIHSWSWRSRGGGVGGTGGFAAPLAAGLAGGIAGNLATDVFKALDRQIAERFLDGWSGIDEHHHIDRALRLAQIDALRIILKRFDDARAADQDLMRRSMAKRFSLAFAIFLDAETEVAQSVAFAKDGGLTLDERKVRVAVLEALPEAFDGLAARRAAGDRNAILNSLAQLRIAVETGVLAEIQFRTLPEGEAVPTLFRAAFEGSGLADGWFDLFLRDAAAKLKEGGTFSEIWRQGLCLFAKRLERGRFLWPSTAAGAVRISTAQLGYLLSGIDWRMPQETWRPRASG